MKDRFGNLIGDSAKMADVFRLLGRVTASDVPVLIAGENGTGKGLAARAIHAEGGRAEGPFVPVSCAAVAEDRWEAELLGDADRPGWFEAAHGGTLFFDGIDRMPAMIQAKFLRVLEDREIRRLGGQDPVKVDVRVLSSSERDLRSLVREGKFREDLFYRIAGVLIPLPSLKERKEDLPGLIDHFLEKAAARHGSRKALTRQAFEMLAAHAWPGNVRELENTITNAYLLCEGPRITPEVLRQKEELSSRSMAFLNLGGDDYSLREAIRAYEKSLIKRALADCNDNISHAAEKLKVVRPQLSRMIKRYNLIPGGGKRGRRKKVTESYE